MYEEKTNGGPRTADALDEAWGSLPPGVTGPTPPHTSAPDPVPGAAPEQWGHGAPSAGEFTAGAAALPTTEPSSRPAPAPGSGQQRESVGTAEPGSVPVPVPDAAPPTASEAVSVPGPAPVPASGPAAESEPESERVPVLGVPRHSGPRAPLYSPHPGRLPSVRDDLDGAVLPDMIVDGATHGHLTVRAASVRGDSHRYGGEPRQDALCVTRLGDDENGLLLLAVADGVGSARRSHIGSNEVCRRIAYFLDQYTDELAAAVRAGDDKKLIALVNSALGSTAERLAQLAAQRGERPEAYATTLRGLLVPLDATVRNRGFFAVGDGGAALLRDGVWTVDVFGEESGGSAVIDTGTAALPGARYAAARVFGPAEPGDVFVLCTDGLSTPLAGDAGMRAFLGESWGRGTVPEPADFLWQLQFRVKSYDDDRTAVCLWEGTG